jgi:hypothetical protein
MAKRTSKKVRNASISCNFNDRKAHRTRPVAGKLFELLENRQLMSTVNVASFGARPNDGADDRGAIQAAINAAQNGDTVVFDNGTFNINGQIALRGGITMTSANGNKGAMLDFNVPVNGGDINGTNYAFRAGNLTDFKFTQLKVKSNNGIFFLERQANNNFTFNDFQWGYRGNYYNKLVFYTGGGASNVHIDRNYFHDSESSDRNLEIWGWSGSYNYNRFHMVNDGGHVMDAAGHWEMIGNVGTKMHRMGIEVQHPCRGAIIDIKNNAFYDWNKPWNDSFGLSVMAREAQFVTISGNYLRADFTGAWGQGQPGQGNRFGIAIETAWGADDATGNGVVENNIVGGPNPWATVVAAGTRNTLVRNNKVYGNTLWGDYMGEPGFWGTGSIANGGGNQKFAANQMPPPPSYDGGGGGGGGGGGDEGDLPGFSNMTGQVLSDTTAKLTWAYKDIDPTKVTAIRVDIVSTVGRENMGSQTFTGHPTSVTLQNLHPGWKLDFTVVAITSTGNVVASPVTLQMTGDPGGGGGGGGDDQHTPAITNVKATVLSDKSAKLSWLFENLDPALVKSIRIEIISTVGREKFPSITIYGNPTSATISPLHPGWQLDLKVVAITKSGKEIAASPITVRMTGDPEAPFDPNEDGKEFVSLTDLTVSESSNGWGPFEKNRSNGEMNANDGRTISIRGKTYAKGFGVHAPSTLVFKINGRYEAFRSDIGLDDETAGDGSVIFQVWGDGKKLYDSGTLLGTSALKSVNVNVTGVMELKLVVTSPTANVSSDHADWANPVLIMPATKGELPNVPMSKTYLDGLRWKYAENHLGDPEINLSNGGSEAGDGSPLTINGRTFNKGLGVTADSLVKYRLNGKYDYFAAHIGMDDATESKGLVKFKIVADGQTIYQSDIVNNTSRARKVLVPVAGKNEVWLVVSDADGAKDSHTHLDWAQSYLLAAA